MSQPARVSCPTSRSCHHQASGSGIQEGIERPETQLQGAQEGFQEEAPKLRGSRRGAGRRIGEG